MLCRLHLTLGLLLLTAGPVIGQEGKFSIKPGAGELPKELNESIRKQLTAESVQFFDPKGTLIGELWFSKQLPSDATAEQIKNGLTYRELRESQLIGAVRFTQSWYDYRKQKVKAGVYTLRLGFQPVDGDHAGKSQYLEFLLLSSADRDTKADPMAHKELTDMSMKSIDAGHPGALMLFPNEKPRQTELVSRPRDHWVLNFRCPVAASGGTSVLGFGLTLVGEADD